MSPQTNSNGREFPFPQLIWTWDWKQEYFVISLNKH